jgi:hypothetical protein
MDEFAGVCSGHVCVHVLPRDDDMAEQRSFWQARDASLVVDKSAVAIVLGPLIDRHIRHWAIRADDREPTVYCPLSIVPFASETVEEWMTATSWTVWDGSTPWITKAAR